MTIARRAAVVCSILAVAAALAYLRDPPWLGGVESGFGSQEAGRDGVRYRWTSGHASFFVPSAASRLDLSLRAAPPDPGDRPQAVTITVDDRLRARLLLTDGDWQEIAIDLPRGGTRRVRRIDLRVDRTRAGRGVAVGAIRLDR